MIFGSNPVFPLRQNHSLHIFGSPLYVFDKKLSDRKKIGNHSSNVPLALNSDTYSVTTQWNVVFYNWFDTITFSSSNLPDFNKSKWSKMFCAKTFHLLSYEVTDDVEQPPVLLLHCFLSQSTTYCSSPYVNNCTEGAIHTTEGEILWIEGAILRIL